MILTRLAQDAYKVLQNPAFKGNLVKVLDLLKFPFDVITQLEGDKCVKPNR